MKKRFDNIILFFILGFVFLIALFSVVSIFHAYSFTHPISSPKGFNPKSMDISFRETALVTVFGVRPERKIGDG